MLLRAFSLKANFPTLFCRPAGHEAVVDGIRALAVLIVIASHVIFSSQFFVPDAAAQFAALPAWLKWPVQGFLGVDMFFVISGFLVGNMLFTEYGQTGGIRLGNFLVRRCLRLMPLFWVALGLTVLMVSADGHDTVHVMNVTLHQNTEKAWKHLLYINNFFRPSETFGAMSHTWSLAVEEQFYLLFPLLLLVFFRTRLKAHPGKLVLLLTLAYLAIRLACRVHSLSLFGSECGFSPEELQHLKIDPLGMVSSEKIHCLFGIETDVMFDNLYTKYIALLAGVVSAYLHVFRKQALAYFYAPALRSSLLLLLSLAAGAFSFGYIFFVPAGSVFNAVYSSFLQQLIFSIAVANLILVEIYGTGMVVRATQAFLSARVFYVLAQCSYSMYLFNLLLVNASYRVASHSVGAHNLSTLVSALLPILIPATLLVSLLAYLLVERPFMNLRALLPARGALRRSDGMAIGR